MKHASMRTLMGIVYLAAGGVMPALAAGPPAPMQAEGRILVRYRSAAVAAAATGQPGPATARSEKDGKPAATRPASLQALDARFGLTQAQRLGVERANAIFERSGKPTEPTRQTRPASRFARSLGVLEFGEGVDLEGALAAYRADPNVAAAEPDYLYRMCLTPSDPLYAGNQAGDFGLIGLPAAWDVRTGASSVIVAVIDSGCDVDHADLDGAVSAAHWDFVNDEADVTDDQGHGTRVCSIVGAEGNNGAGMAGAAYGVTLLPLDVVAADGTIATSDVIEALDYAVTHGAHVINMSFAGTGKSSLLESALAEAAASAVLVAAVGNDGRDDLPMYPAAYAGVIGVAATVDGTATRAGFSNYNGPTVTMADLAAPGTTVLGAFPGDQYDGQYGTGTSFAAPLVSAAAALLLSEYPGMSPGAIAQHLFNQADPAADYATHGLLDAQAALEAAMVPALRVAGVTVDDAGAATPDGSMDKGETVRLIVRLTNDGADATGVTATLSTADGDITLGDTAGAWGTVTHDAATTGTDDFLSVAIDGGALAHDVAFSLAVSADGGYSDTLGFTAAIENKLAISGVKIGQTFVSDTTYHVTGNLLLRNATTIEPGTVFKVDPGVDIQLSNDCQLTAIGTAANPIRFTSAIVPHTDLGLLTRIGPHTQTVNLSSYNHVLHVSVETGSDQTGDGSESSPWKSIQFALDQITDATPGNLYALLVAEGVYKGNGLQVIELKNSVDIYGGYSVENWSRDIIRHPTRIDAEKSRRGVLANANSRIDGFLISNGHDGGSGQGGGITCYDQSPVISNNFIYGNSGVSTGGIGFLGAGSPSVVFNAIVGNSGATGAISCNDTSVLINGNYIADNHGVGYAGGISTFGTFSGVLSNNVIVENTSVFSGAIHATNNTPGTTSNSPLLMNNVVYNNTAGIIGGNCSATMINTVIRNIGIEVSLENNCVVSNCNIEGLWSGSGINNIDEDPEFIGTIAWGFIVSLTYDPVNDWTLLQGVSRVLPSDSLAGELIRIGNQHRLVHSNSDNTITVWGDATKGESVFAPVYWELHDYHIKSTSPNIGAGLGPELNPMVPESDFDGDIRSGAACDIGSDEYNASTAPKAVYWGKLWVTTNASTSTLQHVIVENGTGMLNEHAGTWIGDCTFRGNTDYGYRTMAGTAAIANCTVTLNLGPGIDAAANNLANCAAIYNGGDGLIGAALTDCTAYGNGGDALTGTSATDCTAEFNGGDGMVLTGAATRVVALDNRGSGIVSTVTGIFAVQDAEARLNDGLGIHVIAGSTSGTVVNSVASQNGGGGIKTENGTIVAMDTCTVENNTGVGIAGSGFTGVYNCRITDNSGAALAGATYLQESVVAGNGGGVGGAETIWKTYIAANAGTGISGGDIDDSTIIGNGGNGIDAPDSVGNSWIVGNGGLGINIATAGAPAAVANSTIRDNAGIGVQNLLSLTNSNIHDNGTYEANDTNVSGSADRDYDNNYWGPTHTPVLNASNEFDGLTFIHDVLDGSGNHLIDVWPYAVSPVANAPDATPPAFLLSVTPTAAEPANAQLTTFTLVFSEAMDTGVAPTVTFDLAAPFTANVATPISGTGWIDATTWRGTFAVDLDTGDGTHTLRVSGAVSADGFAIPDDTYHTFTIDTSGGTVANNGVATVLGATSVLIGWDSAPAGSPDQPLSMAKDQAKGGGGFGLASLPTAGFNVLRSTSGAPGSYQQVNGSLIVNSGGPKTTFFDTGLNAGQQYYWVVYRVDTSGNSEVWSGPLSNTAVEAEVLDDETPVADGGGPVDLGTVAQGGAALTRVFTVHNYGYGTMTVSGLTVGGPFQVTEGLAGAIGPAGSDSFTISLPTGTAGMFEQTVSFTTSDADENPYNFTVSGTVTPPAAPEVNVLDGATPIADGGGPVGFGSVTQGDPAPSKTFTVQNTGTAALNTSGLSVPSGYTVTEGLSATIGAGGSDTFTVALGTSTQGTFAGTISFANNDANENPYNWTVTGHIDAPDPALVWVQFGWGGAEFGTQNAPFDTVAEGVAAVEVDGTVRVKAGTSGETIRIAKAMRLESDGGPARIGDNLGGDQPLGLQPPGGRSAVEGEWLLYE
jgi:hypothetical protein